MCVIFSLVGYNAEQFVVACLLDLKVLSLMVWHTVTNQEVFVKSPGSVVVVRIVSVVLRDADND